MLKKDGIQYNVCYVSLQRAPLRQARPNAISSHEMPKELSWCWLCHLPLQRDTSHSKNQPGVTHKRMSASANRPIFQTSSSWGRETHCLWIIIHSLWMWLRFSRIFFSKSHESHLKSEPTGSWKGFFPDKPGLVPQKSNVRWNKIWNSARRFVSSISWTWSSSIDSNISRKQKEIFKLMVFKKSFSSVVIFLS